MKRAIVIMAAIACAIAATALAQEGAGSKTAPLKPQYLPPAELEHMLGARAQGGRSVLEWEAGGRTRSVDMRRNDASNLLLLTGEAADVDAALELARACDVPPRQIAIEARIVEVDTDKARDAGIDWTSLRASAFARQSWLRDGGAGPVSRFNRGNVDLNAEFGRLLQLLESSGAGTTRDAPSILTLNNRPATILDGQRVTYVTRYSSYTNLFATDSMDAGLRLQVLPSLGESGYLRLDLRAELTSISSNISGSPVKDGQIVESSVTVKDGETVMLGGFTRTVDRTEHRRFPVLGRVLPFLFSREIVQHSRRESFIAITPHVVDLAAAVDEKTKDVLEGK